MERNEFLEKCKRNWKKILIIGAASYLALTFISTAVGAAFISDKVKQIDNCEDEIGQAFVERKADFQERFNKNWNDGIDKLIAGFAESEKRSDKFGLDGLKRYLNSRFSNLKEFKAINTPEEVAQLNQEIQETTELVASGEAAFKKKWFSQREDESLGEYERRCDEGKIDWELYRLDYHAMMTKDMTDEFELEDWKEYKERHSTKLRCHQDKFLAKYGEEYPRKSSLSLCNL